MEDNFKFDPLFSRVSRRRPAALRLALYAIAVLALLAAIVLVFLRYQYVERQGVVWRVDRITHQRCRLVNGHADCLARTPSSSLSTSVSTSTSTSTRTSTRTSNSTLVLPARKPRGRRS